MQLLPHAFFLFLKFILLFSFLNYSQSLTTDDERAILLSLKQHWGNPSSLYLWNSTSSPCNWPYISCISGTVVGIYLSKMNIQGSFPSTIVCRLNNLASIHFDMNSLWGTIPGGLSTCSKLETLDLSTNHLTGKIPGELFSMKALRSLYLHQNMLSGEIPTPMVAYSLESVDLSNNHLNGSIPDDIGNLCNLSYLDLSRNSFSGPIPARLLRLHQLSKLSLDFNNLSGKIPGELFSMKTLSSLSLGQNMLSGEISTPIVAYSSEYLDLSSNHLNGSIPDDIGNSYNLGYLDLSRNSFSGPIPATLLQLHQLSNLSLAFNNLSGEIPANLSLSTLTHIDLSHNRLSGSIPRRLGELLQLKNMDVSHNQLSGDIWESVSNLRVRLILNICFNNLSGTIPNKLVKDRFVDSCFDESNLCSDVKDKPACSTEWCSDYTIRGYINCSSKPSKSKIKDYFILATCVVIAVSLLIFLGFLIIREAKKRRWENDGEEERRGENDGEDWSMISYQRSSEFNKWEILGGLTDENLIGKGGSGKVYRVITRKGQRVAVKSIRHEGKQGHKEVKIPGRIWGNIVKLLCCCIRGKSVWHEQKQGQGLMEKQFLAEVKILGGIRHNNIVKLLCCIRGKTTKLIVYEYMDKQCLHEWLHGKMRSLTTQVLQWERRLKIAIGAAQGLCYMHHNCNPPILHRDIKSSNILVDTDFNAKIADFGLAKMLASEEDPETASAVVGTFGYIAPEYGSTTKVNAKSDIYSFGVVLLELTTGREAVNADEDMNLAQWAHKHLREGNSAADAMDEEIKDPRYLEAATTVFKLGLACTLSSPSSRPSMKDILHILQRCSEKNNHLSSES